MRPAFAAPPSLTGGSPLTLARGRRGLSNLAMANKVFVAGGTGKVGRIVVKRLLEQDWKVVAIARNENSEVARELAMMGAEVRKGDVCDLEGLKESMKGCEYVISLVGCRPPRFVKVSDLWSDPRKDPNHPVNVQFEGVKNLLQASKEEKIKKFVRLTGLAVGASPWNPVSILFSLLLSFSTYWNRKGEILLRESGVDYSIIRPGGLKDIPRAREGTDKLFLASEAWGDKSPPFTTGISRADVADLCCLSLTDQRLSRATLRINRMRPPTADNNYFEDPNAKSTWEEMLDTVEPDKKPLEEVDYSLPVGLAATAVAGLLGVIVGWVAKLALSLLG